MATAGELMAYTGNQNLGAGSNADIPISNPDQLGFTNDIIRDIALRNHQKNILAYQQKIRDRDKLYEGLSSGQIKVEDTLERDMPMVNKALDEQTKAFQDWMSKGYGDINGAIAYKKATQKANEVVTQAQARKHYFDTENIAGQKEVLPTYQQKRKEHLEKNLGDFWGDPVPFQETGRLNVEPIEKFTEAFTTELIDAKRPFEKGKRTFVSYSDAEKKASAYGLTPAGSYNLSQLHDTLQEMPPVELYDKVKKINNELTRYNQERGLKAGDRDFATPVQLVPQYDNQGKLLSLDINEPLDKLAAKFSLAGQQQFQKDVWDVDKGKLDVAELKERARHNKAMEGVDWAKYKLEQTKFDKQTKGEEENKNAAMIFANNLLTDLMSKASYKTKEGGAVLDPEAVRKLTADQLKFLGKELPVQRDEDGKIIQSAGLQPLSLLEDDVLEIKPDGTVLILKGAKYNPKKEKWEGEWDNSRSTSIWNAARNVLNEENVKSGTKERNAYLPIDLRNVAPSIELSGRTTTTTKNIDKETGLSMDKGDWKQEGNNWRYKDGTLYDANGNKIKE